MKKERSNKAIYARFVVTILVCAALGGVVGYFTAMGGKTLLETARDLNMALASLGLWWFVPGYVLLAAGTIYYLRGKALLPRAEADDDAFEEADRRLCLALALSGASMVWMFIALGIGGQLQAVVQGLALVGLLVVQLVWITVVQALVVKASKVIHPEKKGNVLDSKFQKDWYQSCDEAEQQKIGQCSYFSFRVTSTVFPLTMLALFFLAYSGMAQPGWVLLVGGLWMVQQMSYQFMAYRLDHGKKKHKA